MDDFVIKLMANHCAYCGTRIENIAKKELNTLSIMKIYFQKTMKLVLFYPILWVRKLKLQDEVIRLVFHSQ